MRSQGNRVGVLVAFAPLFALCVGILLASASCKLEKWTPQVATRKVSTVQKTTNSTINAATWVFAADTTRVQCLGYDTQHMALKVAPTIIDQSGNTKAACDAQDAAVRKASDEHIAALARSERKRHK